MRYYGPFPFVLTAREFNAEIAGKLDAHHRAALLDYRRREPGPFSSVMELLKGDLEGTAGVLIDDDEKPTAYYFQFECHGNTWVNVLEIESDSNPLRATTLDDALNRVDSLDDASAPDGLFSSMRQFILNHGAKLANPADANELVAYLNAHGV